MNLTEPTPPALPAHSPEAPRPRFPWLVFLIVLLAPAIATLLTAGAQSDVAVGIPFFGGGLAGIICGAMLGRRFGRTLGTRIALGMAAAVGFAFVSFMLGFFGCMVGGYNFNIH